jgi:hypothetical protein
MLKKRLIEGKILDKMLSMYPELSPEGKGKFLDRLKTSNPQLARAFGGWENSFVDLLNAVKKVKQKNGQDTKQLDQLISKLR